MDGMDSIQSHYIKLFNFAPNLGGIEWDGIPIFLIISFLNHSFILSPYCTTTLFRYVLSSSKHNQLLHSSVPTFSVYLVPQTVEDSSKYLSFTKICIFPLFPHLLSSSFFCEPSLLLL